MRVEHQRDHSCRTASNSARPATSRARLTTSRVSPVAGGFVPMPSSMIFLKISGLSTATKAATTMSARKTARSRL